MGGEISETGFVAHEAVDVDEKKAPSACPVVTWRAQRLHRR